MIVSTPKAQEAAGVLNVDLMGLTQERVNEHFRRYAKDCHPDYHGNQELARWAQISWAKEVLTYWVAKHPAAEPASEAHAKDDCPSCHGSGRVAVRKRGFGAPLTMQCDICKGMGTILPEENDID